MMSDTDKTETNFPKHLALTKLKTFQKELITFDKLEVIFLG